MIPQTPLERLPSELICDILSEVDDVRTLHSAILSCRRLYRCFSGNAGATIIRVVLNQLDTWDLRPEALIAWHASKLPEVKTPTLVRTFFTQHLAERGMDRDVPLTLDEGLGILKLLLTVEKLAQSFTEHCFENMAYTHADAAPLVAPTTASEKSRIMRALYRYETFCNLFRLPKRGDYRDLKALNMGLRFCAYEFFSLFSPWENEQVCCVYEFLFFKTSPAFNEIAKHDITWGEMRVRPAVSSDSFFFRHVYFEGLVTLARISEADTYERKYELLHNFQASGYCYYDVAAALRASRRLKGRSLPVAFHGQTWIGRYRDGREYASLVQPPFFEDPDDGPFRSWNWAHEANATHFAYFAQPQALLRKWGYTMWDEERLDSLGMMKQWFLTSDLSSEEYSPARREVDELRHNSQGWDWYDSWVARAKIWINGGSGWWDFGDESRIIWKYGKPHDTEPASMLGLSLEES